MRNTKKIQRKILLGVKLDVFSCIICLCRFYVAQLNLLISVRVSLKLSLTFLQ